jgi:serine phosphatase RsbU (regulator of sigma subunit)/anti-sigma regulatory factor (Ser/Thr protein kinase)
MVAASRSLLGRVRSITRRGDSARSDGLVVDRLPLPDAPPIDIAPDDPIIAYFQRASGAVDIEQLHIDSPALTMLKTAGVKMVVPLVSQGELIGMLNLGGRLSEQEYSADDRRLLDSLASHAAPAVRVAQLVRQQQAEAQERESIAQELRIAHLIQQTLLPKQLPDLPGWHISAYYQPARAVGGDFYDFVDLPDGKIGLVIGDASSKGVPAALVMATTRTMLRASAQRLIEPGEVLQRTNDVLCADIPRNMFVTCFYAVLDPATGDVHYANAGHNLPYIRCGDRVVEMRARGFPLGLMPGVDYEEKHATVSPGDNVLLYSDGLVEAHDPSGAMFSNDRLSDLMHGEAAASTLIDRMLTHLSNFTGPDHEQEDDITLVALERSATAWLHPAEESVGGGVVDTMFPTSNETPRAAAARLLLEFSLPSVPGNERIAMQRVADVIGDLGLPTAKLERLKTAVAEATMNAIEHGNDNREELPVSLRVVVDENELVVRIIDQGGNEPIPEPQTPDLEAKLAGLQSPRGWGLFLIKNMVDEMRVTSDATHHAVELVFRLNENEAADEPVHG